MNVSETNELRKAFLSDTVAPNAGAPETTVARITNGRITLEILQVGEFPFSDGGELNGFFFGSFD